MLIFKSTFFSALLKSIAYIHSTSSSSTPTLLPHPHLPSAWQFKSNQIRSNNLIDESISPINPPSKHSFIASSASSSSELPIVDASTNNEQDQGKIFGPFAKDKASVMWPYQSYKPISWDKYYAHEIQDKHVSITSGLAAGITIGVFFAVFLLTFGCRLYSQRSDSRNRKFYPFF